MNKIFLFSIFFIALSVRIFCNYHFQGINGPQDDGFPDYVAYHSIAKSLVNDGDFALGGGLTTRFPPGVPFLIAGVIKTFGESPVFVRIFYSLVGALTCISLFYLACEVFGNKWIGLISSMLLALYPPHFYYSMHFGTEVPLIFFVSLFLLCFVRFIKYSGYKYLLTSSFLLGVCVLIHAGYVIYLLIVTLLTILICFRSIKIPKIAFFLLLTIAVLTPWIYRNSTILGKTAFISTHGGSTIWDGNNPITYNDERFLGKDTGTLLGRIKSKGLESGVDGYGEYLKIEDYSRENNLSMSYSSLKYIFDNTGKLPKVIFYKIYNAFNPFLKTNNHILNIVFTATYVFCYVFQVFGLFLIIKYHKSESILPLAAQYLTFIAISVVFFGLPRYRLFLMPSDILLTSLGIFVVFRTILKSCSFKSSIFCPMVNDKKINI